MSDRRFTPRPGGVVERILQAARGREIETTRQLLSKVRDAHDRAEQVRDDVLELAARMKLQELGNTPENRKLLRENLLHMRGGDAIPQCLWDDDSPESDAETE